MGLDHQRSLTWFYFAWVPWLGGIAHIWLGWHIKNYRLLLAGLAFTLAPLVAMDALVLTWLGQIIVALVYRREFLAHSHPRPLPPPVTLDLNTCSKHDLVYQLGLPIVYANAIMALRERGHQFTHPEELTDLVGIPAATVQRIAPYLTFSYDLAQEPYVSWRRANHLEAERLVAIGLEPDVACQIVAERQRRGPYRSVADLVQRTGLSTEQLRPLL
ncbi:MAG: helix-hairpin-helix domain-containing protein [Gloeomargarita sp. GMQP_bins_44]